MFCLEITQSLSWICKKHLGKNCQWESSRKTGSEPEETLDGRWRDRAVIMEASACLMPKLSGSPGTWSSPLSHVCAQMFLGGSVVAAGCLAHVCWVALPAVSHSCFGGCCCQGTPEGEGQCPLWESSAVLTAFVPVSHLIWIQWGKVLGSTSDPGRILLQDGLGRGQQPFSLHTLAMGADRGSQSCSLSLAWWMLSYARHNGLTGKERHRNLFFPFKQAPDWAPPQGRRQRTEVSDLTFPVSM